MKDAFRTIFSLSAIALIAGLPSHGGLRLIKTTNEDAGQWVDEAKISSLRAAGIGFFDITNFTDISRAAIPEEFIVFPKEMRFQTSVRDALPLIQLTRMGTFLQGFTQFFNRYYRSGTGIESAKWLLTQVEDTIKTSNYTGQITARGYAHWWPQQSVIVRIEGSDSTLANEVVILGAHLDSINRFNPFDEARGANDNGSGTAVILEVLRVLLEAGFKPKRSLEFQWYAAEEDGLLGSGEIANAYYHAGVIVVSMVNFDIVGYNVNTQSIALLTDNSNKDLTQYLRDVTDEYLDFGHAELRCGSLCSDHVPFHYLGYPAASPAEPNPNPFMHTENDVIAIVNFTQLGEYAKLGVGFAIETGSLEESMRFTESLASTLSSNMLLFVPLLSLIHFLRP